MYLNNKPPLSSPLPAPELENATFSRRTFLAIAGAAALASLAGCKERKPETMVLSTVTPRAISANEQLYVDQIAAIRAQSLTGREELPRQIRSIKPLVYGPRRFAYSAHCSNGGGTIRIISDDDLPSRAGILIGTVKKEWPSGELFLSVSKRLKEGGTRFQIMDAKE